MKDDQSLKNIKKLLESADKNIKAAKTQISQILGTKVDLDQKSQDFSINDENIIEGKFDGESMIGDNDKSYPIPANYASKSKLIDGDRLKLTISEDGSFIFKQICPAERKKLIGTLGLDNDQYYVSSNKHKYKVLTASITYFKGTEGDEVTITVPENGKSDWAAVEAIISKT